MKHKMQLVFDALEKMHPGCEVIDFRLTLDPRRVAGPLSDTFYEDLAEAIENAEEIDIASVFS